MRVVCSLVSFVIAGCQSNAPQLVVTSADPQALIEASYAEAGRAVVLRARPGSSEVIDERGRSMTALANTVLQRQSLPVAGLFSNLETLRRVLPPAAACVRHLSESLPPAARESALFADLSRQPALLKRALTATRLAILQAWTRQAVQQLGMSPQERAAFIEIAGRRAKAIATPRASLLPADLSGLLGAERFAKYTALRAQFAQSADAHEREMLP